MLTADHQANVERITAATEADGRGILEAMCREAGDWSRPLEALEMYAEAREFMEQEVAELVQRMRTWSDPPVSWDEIARRLGMSRQSAWTKFRASEEGSTRLRQRPGPRGDDDVLVFTFAVNMSYAKNGEITVPTSANARLDERLPGEGPSWGAMLQSGHVREPVKVRRGHTGGKRYYQVRVPKAARERIQLGAGSRVEVRIDLLGPLTVRVMT